MVGRGRIVKHDLDRRGAWARHAVTVSPLTMTDRMPQQFHGAAPARNAYEVLHVRADAHQAVLQAAYRALAALFHPDADQSAGSARRMAELNDAYAQVRTPERRGVYDGMVSRPRPDAVSAGRVTPPPRQAGGVDSAVLDFGRYRGWSLADLAQRDADYLRWLSRHSSGLRYRGEIARRLDVLARRPTGLVNARRR
jgi:curved DNA-binding protein CbpA